MGTAAAAAAASGAGKPAFPAQILQHNVLHIIPVTAH